MNPRYLRDDAALERRGIATRVQIALALVAARKAAGLTQPQLATRAAWKPQFVARLESLQGPLPNLVSVLRYAAACPVDLVSFFQTPILADSRSSAPSRSSPHRTRSCSRH
jgi:transcriptional regulator with XRE-family HTH domain